MDPYGSSRQTHDASDSDLPFPFTIFQAIGFDPPNKEYENITDGGDDYWSAWWDRKREKCCCNEWQWESLIVIGSTALVTLVLWKSVLLAPFKLIAVFLHEFSHALVTWLTCGKVIAIEINENFGGVTQTEGGVRWLILSAGYTGSVLWGAFFMFMSWSKFATRVAAALFTGTCAATCLVLKIEDNEKKRKKKTCGLNCRLDYSLRFCIAILGTLPILFWIYESFHLGEDQIRKSMYPLRWFILNTGTMCTLHAVYDCLHDVLFETFSDHALGTSDAVLFAREFYGSPRCWGLLWSVISLLVVILVLFGVIMLEGDYH